MSFLWHDYETFGTDPAYDRPAQFAALRTDDELEPVGEPMTWYARPADDFLPHPGACLVTGITPQHAAQEGEPEAVFAGRIHQQMMQPGTCSAGYNSLRFDDAFTRHLFYRNFFDPYEREYLDGNSRWDLIDLVRMTYALRPEGLEWPRRADGSDIASFRLEDLTEANGIAHEGAHDALVDVKATIGLARALRRAQPRLFEWGLRMRDRSSVEKLLDFDATGPVLYTASHIPAERGCTTLVMPLATVPDRPREIIAFDLMSDPSPLLELDAEAIATRVFTRSDELDEGVERIPLLTIGANKVPMVAPAAVLKGVDQERIALNSALCEKHRNALLRHRAALKEKLMNVYLRPPLPDHEDPDGMLYSGGFFSNGDRAGFRALRRVRPEELARFEWKFDDPRVPEMLFRYRARNWPETLDEAERERWEQDRQARLTSDAIPNRLNADAFWQALEAAQLAAGGKPEQTQVLDGLEEWAYAVLG